MINGEQPSWNPTTEDVIEAKYGKDRIEESKALARSLYENIKTSILALDTHPAGSRERETLVDEHLSAWRTLTEALFHASGSASDVQVATIAIQGAAALISREKTHAAVSNADKMVKELRERYAIE